MAAILDGKYVHLKNGVNVDKMNLKSQFNETNLRLRKRLMKLVKLEFFPLQFTMLRIYQSPISPENQIRTVLSILEKRDFEPGFGPIFIKKLTRGQSSSISLVTNKCLGQIFYAKYVIRHIFCVKLFTSKILFTQTPPKTVLGQKRFYVNNFFRKNRILSKNAFLSQVNFCSPKMFLAKTMFYANNFFFIVRFYYLFNKNS